MTIIKVGKDENNKINFIEVAGHSGFAPLGLDIVCSSISSTITLITNILMELDEDGMDYLECDDLVRLDLYYSTDITELILTNFINTMKELQTQYSNNVSVIEI